MLLHFLQNKKGENFFSPFLPQIYHKLNLLMLWFNKYKVNVFPQTKIVDELHQKSIKRINSLKFSMLLRLFPHKNS